MPLWMVVKRKDYLLAAMKATEDEIRLRLLAGTAVGNGATHSTIDHNGRCQACDCKEFKCKEFVY
jgi:hypothetical protein